MGKWSMSTNSTWYRSASRGHSDSLTVVLAHYALGRGQIKQATIYVAITLVLGFVFLIVKAVSCPGVTITRAATSANAANPAI